MESTRVERGPSLVPGEVQARPGNAYAYDAYRKHDALRGPCSLPGQFLQGIRPEAYQLPEAPLIVFINARSGGRSGPELAVALSRSLGRAQVFDLSEYKPDKVLTALWANFQAAIDARVPNAELYRSRLRVLVAGGDGTIAWVLGTIKALKLRPEPAVAMMPLGTGNDLSRSFNWGPAYDSAWITYYSGLYNTLHRISAGQVELLDCWHVSVKLPDEKLMAKVPHSLKVTRAGDMPPPTPSTDTPLPSPSPGLAPTPAVRADGLFWNYMSVGLDARAAYYFHHLRETKPHMAKNRMMNQFWYAFYSCTSGWFCCTKSVSSKVELSIQRPGSDDWIQVPVLDGVKALVVLNLQSYAGGRNLWGKHTPGSMSTDGKTALREPSHNDGLLEVVGLGHGIHTSMVMGSKGTLVHAKRLCQASGVRMSLKAQYVRPDGDPSHAYVQIDGEPWIQDVPSSADTEPIVVEVRHAGVSKVLRNKHGFGPAPATSTPPSATTPLPHAALVRAMHAEMVSVPGTIVDSEAVQVGSERASSMRSGNSWSTPHLSQSQSSITLAQQQQLKEVRPGSSTGQGSQAGMPPLPTA